MDRVVRTYMRDVEDAVPYMRDVEDAVPYERDDVGIVPYNAPPQGLQGGDLFPRQENRPLVFDRQVFNEHCCMR